jgi:SM-20-related protein
LNKNELKLASIKPEQNLISDFLKNGIVKVPNALSIESANLIAAHIKKQKVWNLVFDHNGTHKDLNNIEVESWTDLQKENLLSVIHHQAETGFQYHYETIPLYDIYHDNLLPEHFFNEIMSFLNEESTLEYFRILLSCPEITFADGQITRFKAGHFLNKHNDDVDNKNRVAAFVLNLTEQWRPDWGGALHILDDHGALKQSFLPTYNEINIFKIPVDHYVGYVSPFAVNSRLSITGWLRTGKNPKLNRGSSD